MGWCVSRVVKPPHGILKLTNRAQVWVVDSADRYRLEDCRAELHALLTEEVRDDIWHSFTRQPPSLPWPLSAW